MKKYILSVLLFIAMALGAKAMPACITNITVCGTIGGGIVVTGASSTNYTCDGMCAKGMPLMGSSCTNGTTLTFLNLDCSTKSSTVVGTIMWACDPSCGPGGQLNVTLPKGSYAVTVRIYECGQCCLTYCVVGTTPCPQQAPSTNNPPQS